MNVSYMKKEYKSPVMLAVNIHARHIMAISVQGDAGLKFGGAGDGTEKSAARVKSQGGYRVWDDDWNK